MASIDMAGGAPRAQTGAEIDLLEIGRAVWARRRLVILLTLIVFAASFVAVNLMSPRYTAEAKLLLERRDSFFTRPAGEREGAGDAAIDDQAVKSQVQLITSRDVARETIRRLKLVGNPEFDPAARGIGLIRSVLVMLGLVAGPAERSPEDRVMKAYYERLLVFPVRESRVLTIEFTSKDPELAARAANTLAEVYLEAQESAKKEVARNAGAWLSGAVDEMRTKVAQAEAKVEEFRARSGLFVGTNNQTLSSQQLAELSTQLAGARSAQAEAQAKAKILREAIRAGRILEVPDVANNELVRRLNEQRATVSAQLAFESRTLLPAHPRIKELGAQLADLDAQIRATAERTVRTLEANARIAGSRVDSVLAEIEAQKQRAGQANEAEVQLRALEREAKAQREQLESYLARYREAVTRDTEMAVPADARVISRANAPGEPSFPKKGSIVVIATLASFLGLLAWIVAREMVSGRGGPTLAFARGAGAPFEPAAPPAVVMPLATAEPAPAQAGSIGPPAERIAAVTRTAPPSPEQKANIELGHLVSFIQAMGARGRAAVVLVSSAGDPEAGAAFAVSLSRSLSRDTRAVALDLDPARRGLSAAASLAGAPGMAELLHGELTFSEAIHRDRRSRLHVIPAGAGAADLVMPPDDGRTVRVVVEALQATYDAVVIVVPPARAEAVAGALARLVDAAVIVDIDEGEDGERLARDMHDAGVTRVLPVSIVAEPQGAEAAAS